MESMIPNIREIKDQQMALIPVGQRIIEQFQMHDTQQAVLTNNVQELTNSVDVL